MLSFAPLRADELGERITMAQTFLVQSVLDAHDRVIGTGVLVRRDGDVLTIVTARHVLRDGTPVRIVDSARRAYDEVVDAELLPQYDLALIRVRARADVRVDAVEFATPFAGEPVWVWGHPRSTFWRKATGSVRTVASMLPGESGTRMTITCAQCQPGDSGAGVFAGDGKLLGIIVAGWEKTDGGPVLFVEAVTADAIANVR